MWLCQQDCLCDVAGGRMDGQHFWFHVCVSFQQQCMIIGIVFQFAETCLFNDRCSDMSEIPMSVLLVCAMVPAPSRLVWCFLRQTCWVFENEV